MVALGSERVKACKQQNWYQVDWKSIDSQFTVLRFFTHFTDTIVKKSILQRRRTKKLQFSKICGCILAVVYSFNGEIHSLIALNLVFIHGLST